MLQVAFIVLKLLGILGWKWVWVLTPLWLSFIWLVVLVIINVMLAE